MALKPTVVQTTHVTTAADNVPIVDVYGEGRTTPLNNIVNAIDEFTSGILKSADGLMPKPELLEMVRDVTSLVIGGKEAIEGRLKDISKEYRNVVKSVSADMVGEILKSQGYEEITPELIKGVLGMPGTRPVEQILEDSFPSIRVIYNDTVKKIVKGDYKNASDLAGMLETVTGDTKLAQIFDLKAQFAVMHQVVYSARALGITDVYDTVVDQIRDEEDKREFLLQAVSAAALSNDLVFVNNTLSLCGVGRVLQRVPDIISKMLQGYRRKDITIKPQDAIQETLNTIATIDSNWDKTPRGGEMVSKLEPFSLASADSIEALSLIDQYRAPAVISKNYPAVDVVKLGQAMWPINTIAS